MNKYLEKIALNVSKETRHDAVDTATLGAVGGLEGLGVAKLFSHPKLSHLGSGKKFAIGAGLTLGVDYAGLQVAKGINSTWDKAKSTPKPQV